MSLTMVIFLLLWVTLAQAIPPQIHSFHQCLTPHNQSDAVLYLPTNSSYTPLLHAYIRNRRFTRPTTPKPLAIVAPTDVAHIQSAVICAKLAKLQLRVRSGGHDYAGQSVQSPAPFVILDMNNLRSIRVDIASKTAWVEAGATVGELYYAIANRSTTLAFPAGVCPTMGVGGHFVGGGYGNLLRKYGLAVDNVLDARVVDADGRVLDRSTMGDLFWAIRGGGGGSFGVILAWKIKLVNVPEIVTVFQLVRKLDEGASDVFHRWMQISTELTPDLFIRASPEVIPVAGGGNEIQISFTGEYLGPIKKLAPLLNEKFPELGFKAEDGKEMSWLESVLFWAPFPDGTPAEALLSRKSEPTFNKLKSDYVTEVIPREALPRIWEAILKVGPSFTKWNPYGGRMAEIPANETAYAHRAGYLFKVQYYVGWSEDGEKAEARHVAALTAFYEAMTAYVTKEPREAFFNYRDLDNGEDSVEKGDWERARVYGEKYFKGHFVRLSKIKKRFDPGNFFRDQQSIPPFPN